MPRRVDRIHTAGGFDHAVSIALMRGGFMKPGVSTIQDGIAASWKFIEALNTLYHEGASPWSGATAQIFGGPQGTPMPTKTILRTMKQRAPCRNV